MSANGNAKILPASVEKLIAMSNHQKEKEIHLRSNPDSGKSEETAECEGCRSAKGTSELKACTGCKSVWYCGKVSQI